MPSATHLSDPVIPISIAVLGIGLMGYPMARRLCEAGHQVTAWNRSRAKAERLEPFGARVADTPAQAVAQADVVITLLENGDVVEDVLFRQGAATALRPGTLVVDMMYGPKAEPFAAWARAQGATVRDGLGMLVEQAAEAFVWWRGVRPATAEVIRRLSVPLV